MSEKVWYGSCGVAHCDDCLPRFDADNNPLRKAIDLVRPELGGAYNLRNALQLLVAHEYVRDWNKQGDPMTLEPGDSGYASDLRPQDHTGEYRYQQFVTLDHFTGWGDYHGSAVDRSNSRSLVRDYPDTFVTFTGDYGYETLALVADQDIPEDLFDILVNLADQYPLYDESDYSELEMELFDADLDLWIEPDVRREIESANGDECLDEFSEETLSGWIREYSTRDDATESPHAENAVSIRFDVEPCARWIVENKLTA